MHIYVLELILAYEIREIACVIAVIVREVDVYRNVLVLKYVVNNILIEVAAAHSCVYKESLVLFLDEIHRVYVVIVNYCDIIVVLLVCIECTRVDLAVVRPRICLLEEPCIDLVIFIYELPGVMRIRNYRACVVVVEFYGGVAVFSELGNCRSRIRTACSVVGSDACPYRHILKAGPCLVVVKPLVCVAADRNGRREVCRISEDEIPGASAAL